MDLVRISASILEVANLSLSISVRLSCHRGCLGDHTKTSCCGYRQLNIQSACSDEDCRRATKEQKETSRKAAKAVLKVFTGAVANVTVVLQSLPWLFILPHVKPSWWHGLLNPIGWIQTVTFEEINAFLHIISYHVSQMVTPFMFWIITWKARLQRLDYSLVPVFINSLYLDIIDTNLHNRQICTLHIVFPLKTLI